MPQDLLKRQLISKCLFGNFNTNKKRTKKFDFTKGHFFILSEEKGPLLWYLKSNCFRSVFGRIEGRHLKDISKLSDL